MEESGAEQTSPSAQPEQAKDSEALVVLKVPLVCPKCTFVGNSRGEKHVLLYLHSSGLRLMSSVDKTLLIHLDVSVPGFLL